MLAQSSVHYLLLLSIGNLYFSTNPCILRIMCVRGFHRIRTAETAWAMSRRLAQWPAGACLDANFGSRVHALFLDFLLPSAALKTLHRIRLFGLLALALIQHAQITSE